MPRKVFISFLGTSKYNECEYVKDDFSYRSSFIQEATFRYLTSIEEWSENDRILILLTKQAEEKNWEGLNSLFKDIAGQTVVDTIRDIPEGKNEQEIYAIFQKVYEYLLDCDILYFDLTHGFRYLPMLILVLGNYAKFLKNVTVKSITYGNWEMSANGTKPAPITDLLPLSELQDWTFAAGQFIKSGNAEQLTALSEKEYTPILRDTLGKDESARRLKAFSNSLSTIVSERQTCRGLDIFSGNSVKRINNDYHCLPIESSKPYAPIFQKIADTWADFNEEYDVLNGIKAAKWCFDKGLYLQAATCLEESVLFYYSIKLGLNPLSGLDQKLLAGGFDYASNSFSKRKDDSFYSDDIRKIGKTILESYQEIIRPLQVLKEQIRNDFNHAGIRNNPQKSDTIKNNLEKQLNTILSFMLGLPRQDGNSDSRLFINLSNHSSDDWKESQLKEAKSYGRIVDIPFPTVSPNCSPTDIESLSEETIASIIKEFPHDNTTIHIMGEMTLTYALVTELKALGYTCVASTTERKVTIDKNGDKIVHFEFVQFREY